MTDDLVTWLRAQLDEDERVARAAIGVMGGRWKVVEWGAVEVDGDMTGHTAIDWTVCFDEGAPSEEQAEHIARHDPAGVLAEVDAKRRNLALHRPNADGPDPDEVLCWGCADPVPCTVRLLALPYADRPGYDERWRP